MEGQETTRERGGWCEGLDYGPWFVGCATPPLAVGMHSGQVLINCTLTRYEPHAPLRMRLKSLARGRRLDGALREIGSYKSHFEVPLKIDIVEPQDAEQVALVSDPRLEEIIRQSFTCHHRDGSRLRGEPRPVAYNGVAVLTWKESPIALVFETVLRLPDGQEIPHPSHRTTGVGRFRTRAGSSEVLYCTPFLRQLPLAVPGQYEATIVLRPDPNFAYDDPTIKEIWGGTLEFPMSFSLYEETPVR